MRRLKTDLVAALKKAFAYCDGAYDGLTHASAGAEMATGGTGRTRFAMLN